jgi:glycosyltransferase involved in cell wall biosynthesis
VASSAPDLHVCLISIELFPDGVHGGFGRATRVIGRELARRGVRVSVVVPRRSPAHADVYELDGMTVRQFDARRPWRAMSHYRACNADVYHSQDTSVGTRLALHAAPRRQHVITFRDPMDARDWKIETDYSGRGRIGWTLYRHFIDGPLVDGAIPRVQARYCAAEFLRGKVARKYGLTTPPGFLPTPVEVPERVEKSPKPTVCFVGRWEGRKRPERFFELARELPNVRFVAIGGAQDAERDRALRRTFGALPNLELTGFVDQFSSDTVSRVLGESWILVNTSAREGLPNTFLEASAHRCALLSYSDPDGFASRFGIVATDEAGGLRAGLESLLDGDRWRAAGEAGHAYVRQIFATDRAIAAHLEAYRSLTQAS